MPPLSATSGGSIPPVRPGSSASMTALGAPPRPTGGPASSGSMAPAAWAPSAPGPAAVPPPSGARAPAKAASDELSVGALLVRALGGLVIVAAITWVALSLAPTEIASNEVPTAGEPTPATSPGAVASPSLADPGAGAARPDGVVGDPAPSEGPTSGVAVGGAPAPDGSLHPDVSLGPDGSVGSARRYEDPRPREALPEPTSRVESPPPTPRPAPPEVEPSGPFTLTVSHRAVRRGAAGASTLVSAKVNGPRSTAVVLRSGPEDGPYSSTTLKARGGGRWEGWLQFGGAPGDTIEYWIEADHPRADNTGRSGSRSDPHRIPLK